MLVMLERFLRAAVSTGLSPPPRGQLLLVCGELSPGLGVVASAWPLGWGFMSRDVDGGEQRGLGEDQGERSRACGCRAELGSSEAPRCSFVPWFASQPCSCAGFGASWGGSTSTQVVAACRGEFINVP